MKKPLAALLRAAADRLDPPKSYGIHISTMSEADAFEVSRYFNRRYASPDELARLRRYVPASGH